MNDREQLIYLLEPIMSGSACEHESDSCEMVDCRMCQAIHLADHLIANGVVVLPCKVGETVYCLRDANKPELMETTIEKIVVKNKGYYMKLACNFMYETSCNSIGKTVFYSKEEALAKMKEA